MDRNIPDNSHFDNHINSTQLPVRSVFKTPEKLPILSSTLVTAGSSQRSLWCGTKYEIILIFDIAASQIEYCRKKYSRSRYEVAENEEVVSLVSTEGEGQYVWALTTPTSSLYCWSVSKEELLATFNVSQLTPHRGERDVVSVLDLFHYFKRLIVISTFVSMVEMFV